jgi:hypothetical protein
MAKNINFKTANKFLLNAISKAPEKKQGKVFKDKFAIYEKRMQANANAFFKTKSQADDFMYTVKTIKKRLSKKLANGSFDQKEFQRQMNGLITRSRNYQKQVKVVDKNIDFVKNSDDGSRFLYIITHAVKTGIHSDECAADLANQPTDGYTKEESEEILSRKPNHNNCTCHMKEAPKKQTSRRFEQGNI